MSLPARKDEADWLVELTGDVGNDYRTDVEAGGGKGLIKAPVTAQEFHSRWRESEKGKAVDQAREGFLVFSLRSEDAPPCHAVVYRCFDFRPSLSLTRAWPAVPTVELRSCNPCLPFFGGAVIFLCVSHRS